MRRIRLVIADRRPIVLQGFETLFATERDFEIVASCINGADCLEAVRTLTPDVALVEDRFPDLTASAMLAAVSAESLPTRLVFYTASIARGDLAAAVAAGACTAIPMREEPENLLQSLRLVAPNEQPAARKAGNGASGENGLAALTDQERRIMRLVASGMSNKEIARELKVAPGTIQARIDQISARLGIKGRTELASFALSRLYGGVGALAALIWAALDDVQSANAAAFDHAHADNFTVMTADGAGAVVTIKISPQKANAASGRTAKAVRIENSLADMPTRASKLIESRADIAGSTITVPPLNPSRPGLSSAGTFMTTAVGISIYELLSSDAQALNVWDGPSDVFAWADANAPSEFVALNGPGRPDLSGFDKLPWLDSDIDDGSFAVGAARGDAMARRDEAQIIDAAAREDSFSASGNPHIGSGAVDALSDHGVEHAATTNARNAKQETTQTAAVDARDQERSQRDLHASEDGAASGKPETEHGPPDHASSQGKSHVSEKDAAAGNKQAKHEPPDHDPGHGQSKHDSHASEKDAAGKKNAEHEPPGHDPGHGQSKRDSHASERDAAGKKNAEHEPPGHDPGHGQSKDDLHAAENGAAGKDQGKQNSKGHDADPGQVHRASKDDSAAAKQHANDDVPGTHAGSGQAPPDLSQAHPEASKSSQKEPTKKTGGNDQAQHDSGAEQTAAAPKAEDTFRFKNDPPAPKHADHLEIGSGADTAEHGLHHAGHTELAAILNLDPIGHSHAEQSAVDHARGIEQHPTQDLFV